MLPGDWRGTRLVDSGGWNSHTNSGRLKVLSIKHLPENFEVSKRIISKRSSIDLFFWNVLVFQQTFVWDQQKSLPLDNARQFKSTIQQQKRLTLVRNTELEFLDAPGFIPVGFGRRFSKDMRKFLSAPWSFFLYFFENLLLRKIWGMQLKLNKRGSFLICETVACWPLMCFWILFLRTPGEDRPLQTRRSSKLFCVCAESLVKRPV